MLELTLDGVTKKYGKKTAVNRVSVTLKQGVYGLLGANGSGKTTLLRMICGILETTEGNVLYGGTAIGSMGAEYRRILGYLPQDFGYYPEFTAKRFLMYLAALKAIPKNQAEEKVEELLKKVDLSALPHVFRGLCISNGRYYSACGEGKICAVESADDNRGVFCDNILLADVWNRLCTIPYFLWK